MGSGRQYRLVKVIVLSPDLQVVVNGNARELSLFPAMWGFVSDATLTLAVQCLEWCLG